MLSAAGETGLRTRTCRDPSTGVRRCAAPHAGPRPASSLRTCDHRPMQYRTVRVGIPYDDDGRRPGLLAAAAGGPVG